MPPRAMWTGQLRLSLVSFGVRLYAATESAKKVSMNQLHRDCHQRVRNQLVCPTHGPINRDEIVKGYEYEKDSYVIISQEDLEGLRLKSTKTIELVQFVDATEIDPLYINSPYYLGPDGHVAEQAYSVIREAMGRLNKVGIGKFVSHGREHVVALQGAGRGFMLSTLRYPSEVRQGDQFFADITSSEVDEEQVTLAQSIMGTKASAWDPSQFKDHYQEAFFEIVKAKVEGAEPVVVDDEDTTTAFNFMDALKQSVADAEAETDANKKAAAKKTRKKSTRKKPAASSVKSTRKKAGRKGA